MSIVAAITLDELINSYNQDFNAGIINMTVFSDQMIDSNSNGINDTLVITLTTNVSSGNYYFIGELDDSGKIITSEVNATLTTNTVNITFDTMLMSEAMYNYSIKIYDSTNSFIYQKDKIETNFYGSYEQGISIISVSDQNVNDDLIRVSLNLNVTENMTTNVTVYLNYNNNTIHASKEVTLTSPSQSVNIDFGNETIKSTHYDGIYTVDAVKIGDKLIQREDSTSSYNFETFAKTSYFQKFNSCTYDLDSNNISKFLQINFTINYKSTGIYSVDSKLYDLYGNYITNFSRTQVIGSTGLQVFTINVNGTNIYSSNIDGPYLVKYAKLTKNGGNVDFIEEPHTTSSLYYADFERPPLADLTIDMDTSFNSGITNITLNVSNLGSAVAANIFVNIFNNESYENQSSIPYLDIDESEILTFSVGNTTQKSIFTAIVDFSNYVEESNESNNIVQNIEEVSNLTISSLVNITINNTHMIFQFIINNTGETTLSDVNWTLDAGDGSSIITGGENTFSLSPGKTALVFIEYNYTTESTFIVNATASAGTLTAHKTLNIYLGNATPSSLDIYDFFVYDVSSTHKVFSFGIKNIGEAQNLTDVSWSLNTGTETIDSDSQYSFNLTPNNFSLVYVEYNYTQTGDFTAIASASSGVNEDSETLNIDIPDIEVSNLSLMVNDSLHRVFFFAITNTLLAPMDYVNWSFDTDDNYVIAAVDIFGLNESKIAFVFIEYNYSSTGTYTVNATAINGTLKDSTYYTFTIS